jgi:prepilin-type processing-associated H-X9-DG protein
MMYPSQNEAARPSYRHFGGANYLLADGHVKWLKLEDISFGWRATSATADESYSGGYGSIYAQGTQYVGTNKKAYTFSYR